MEPMGRRTPSPGQMKSGKDEIGGIEPGLAHQAAHGFAGTQAARAGGWERTSELILSLPRQLSRRLILPSGYNCVKLQTSVRPLTRLRIIRIIRISSVPYADRL